MNNNVGEMIKLLRKEQGMTQDDLAIALNITNQSISKWENGLANPDITFIPIIAKFFGVSIETLFAYEFYATDEEYRHTAKAQKQLLLADDIDSIISLWENLHMKYPNDFRIQKELVVAMCEKKDKLLFDKIFENVVVFLRKNQNSGFENEILNALKMFLMSMAGEEKATVGKTHKGIAADNNLGALLKQSEIYTLFQTVPNKKAKGKRVLIVDDIAFMRTMLTEVLTNSGYEVIGSAVNGFEAIEAANSLAPDIIIMDIVMPGMDGLDASKQILQEHEDLPIVMCSAMSQHQTVLNAIEIGASGFLAKPFMSEELIKTIEVLL